jgi:hypothetical protein
MTVEIAACSENEVVIEISPDKMNKRDDDDEDDDNETESKTCGAETAVLVTPNQHCTNMSNENCDNAEPVSELHGIHTASQKYRSMSESSGDEFVSIHNGQSCCCCCRHRSPTPSVNIAAGTLLSRVVWTEHKDDHTPSSNDEFRNEWHFLH